MGMVSRHPFVWPERMMAARNGKIGAERRDGFWGGGVYLIIHPHTRTSLHLDNDKNSGVLKSPKKGEG